MIKSHTLVFSDFETEWYKFWANELKQNKKNTGKFKRKSNKFWQNAVISQSLSERGLLNEGRTGIGFGVGKERLPALFAKYGVKVSATDQDFRTTDAKHWGESELATQKSELNELGICNTMVFNKNVNLFPLDMRNIPLDLKSRYDFVWSNCALGHLGSIKNGLDFILASSTCLKPGGYAVHTTEVNVLSDDKTVDAGHTVIYRPRDLHKLYKMLQRSGFNVSPLRFTLGNTQRDHRISMSPKFGNDFSKIQVGGHLVTQAVIIIHRPNRVLNIPGTELIGDLLNRQVYRYNLRQQQSFANTNPFLVAVKQHQNHPLSPGDIVPLQTNYTINLYARPKYLYVLYVNRTNWPLFSVFAKFNGSQPIVIATESPEDHRSQFVADDWLGADGNRASSYLYAKQADGVWKKIDYIRPGAKFAFRLKLDPRKTKPGEYIEHFGVIQENVAHLPDTRVAVTIKRV